MRKKGTYEYIIGHECQQRLRNILIYDMSDECQSLADFVIIGHSGKCGELHSMKSKGSVGAYSEFLHPNPSKQPIVSVSVGQLRLAFAQKLGDASTRGQKVDVGSRSQYMN